MVTTKEKTSPNRPSWQEGKVILHVYVDPGIRSGIHMLASLADANAEDVLRDMVSRELRSKGLPDTAASS